MCTDDLSRQLDGLLAQDLGRLRRKEQNLFDELVDPVDPLVLFGAGGLGRKTLRGLRQIGRNVLAFADNNPQLQGSQVDGVPVLSVARAAEKFGALATFIMAVFMDSAPRAFNDRRGQFTALGCRNVQPFYLLFWRYPDQFLPHYAYDLPHKVLDAHERVRAAWKLLRDESSRREFLAQVTWRLDPFYSDLPPHSLHEIYFPPNLTLGPSEVFVDCGAYDGDTLRAFLRHTGGKFASAHALEPDPRNFHKLQRQVADSVRRGNAEIHAVQCAVGATKGTVYLDAQGGLASALSDAGEHAVRCETLDSLLDKYAATYIKMDIEGAEIHALNGGAQHIRRHRPALAISGYHLQEHLWEIPLLIHSLYADYRISLHRYGAVPFDNLVIYAAPSERWS